METNAVNVHSNGISEENEMMLATFFLVFLHYKFC